MFDRKLFETEFNKAIKKLAASERVTREQLKVLSRTILEATHETGDIAFVNRLLAVLTPVNKKVAVLFFKTFTGFRYDDTALMFTAKNKKQYDTAHAAYVKFIEDPNNNIWSWADRHIEVEQKPFDADKVTTYIKGAIAKSSQADVMRAVIKAGVELDTLILMLGEMGADVKVTEEDTKAE